MEITINNSTTVAAENTATFAAIDTLDSALAKIIETRDKAQADRQAVRENNSRVFQNDSVIGYIMSSQGGVSNARAPYLTALAFISPDNEVPFEITEPRELTMNNSQGQPVQMNSQRSTLFGAIAYIKRMVEMGTKKNIVLYVQSNEVIRISGCIARALRGEPGKIDEAQLKWIMERPDKYGSDYLELVVALDKQIMDAHAAGFKVRCGNSSDIYNHVIQNAQNIDRPDLDGRTVEFRNGTANIGSLQLRTSFKLNGPQKLVNDNGRLAIERVNKKGSERDFASKLMQACNGAIQNVVLAQYTHTEAEVEDEAIA